MPKTIVAGRVELARERTRRKANALFGIEAARLPHLAHKLRDLFDIATGQANGTLDILDPKSDNRVAMIFGNARGIDF